MRMMYKELKILGIKLHKLDFNETINTIEGFVNARVPRLVVTLGTEMVMSARKNKTFKDVLDTADLVCADAVGLLWASKIAGEPLKEKVAGIDILTKIAQLSENKGWRLFFLGASPGTAETAVNVLSSKYPGMIIAGFHHGYFDDDFEIKKMIKDANPDILFIALGSPKQELWFVKNREELGVPVGIGVGGSFDVLSGKLKRSPKWMINLGLEWLYRLYLEPWRWKRMTVLPVFAVQVLLDRIFCQNRNQ